MPALHSYLVKAYELLNVREPAPPHLAVRLSVLFEHASQSDVRRTMPTLIVITEKNFLFMTRTLYTF